MFDKVNNSIEDSSTLPSFFYAKRSVFEKCIERIFINSWQIITEKASVENDIDAYPFELIEKSLSEPLYIVNNNGTYHCYSNVCTHRGNIILDDPRNIRNGLVCGYHGKRFDHMGKFLSMPESSGMKNFPCEKDNLSEISCDSWRQFIFTSINPNFSLTNLLKDVDDRVGWMPIEDFKFREDLSKQYYLDVNWALYCDNYLEGFHIPFIHKELSAALDYASYDVEIFDYSNLQIGYGEKIEDCFDLPENSPEYGKKVAAYYFWMFPNIMMNFYPWGLSLNIISPVDFNKTKIEFKTYVWKENLLNKGAGADVNKVELEDQEIIKRVQKGVNSRLYKEGRFSPRMEKGVHHFHNLIKKFMS